MYEQNFKNSPDLQSDLAELRGKTLICHCGPDQECHGDVLLAALRAKAGPQAEGVDEMATFVDDGLPARLYEPSEEADNEAEEEAEPLSVSFADSVVTEIRRVPYYKRNQLRTLFYTPHEVQNFKTEYRREK